MPTYFFQLSIFLFVSSYLHSQTITEYATIGRVEYDEWYATDAENIALNNDESKVAFSTDIGGLIIWDITNNKLVSKIPFLDFIYESVALKEPEMIAVCTGYRNTNNVIKPYGRLLLYDWSGNLVSVLDSTDSEYLTLCVSPENQYLTAYNSKDEISTYSIQEKKETHSVRFDFSIPWEMYYNSGNTKLFFRCDNSLLSAEIKNNKIKNIETVFDEPISFLQLVTIDTLFAALTEKDLYLINSNGSVVLTTPLPTFNQIWHMEYNSLNKKIVCFSNSGDLYFFDINTHAFMNSLKIPDFTSKMGRDWGSFNSFGNQTFRLNKTMTKIFTANSDGSITIWDIKQ